MSSGEEMLELLGYDLLSMEDMNENEGIDLIYAFLEYFTSFYNDRSKYSRREQPSNSNQCECVFLSFSRQNFKKF